MGACSQSSGRSGVGDERTTRMESSESSVHFGSGTLKNGNRRNELKDVGRTLKRVLS